MIPMPKKKDPSLYPAYHQYAFRATRAEVEAVQEEIESLYEKFNAGRDPKNPEGRRAVKASDIALEALKIGLSALKKRSKWDFSQE